MIGGDGLVMSIAAASIIAKVTRDRLMCALAQDCPGYGFETHKGYGVPEHREALDRLGPSVHHRRFFAPVVAAREKHQPRDRRRQTKSFAVETQISLRRFPPQRSMSVASAAAALYQMPVGLLSRRLGISGGSCVSLP